MKTLVFFVTFTFISYYAIYSQFNDVNNIEILELTEKTNYDDPCDDTISSFLDVEEVVISIDSINVAGLSFGDSVLLNVRIADIDTGNSLKTCGLLFIFSFDKDVLTLQGVDNFNDKLPGPIINLYNDSLYVNWLNPFFCTIPMYEGESFFDIVFTYNGSLATGDTSFIVWNQCLFINGYFGYFTSVPIDGFIYYDEQSDYPVQKNEQLFHVWPSGGKLIVVNNGDRIAELFMYDLNGRLIKNRKVYKGQNSFYVNGSNNIHLIRIQLSDYSFTRKIFTNNGH